MPTAYRATQKTVKALDLIVKYIDSAISRCDDDHATEETRATLPLLRDLAVATAAVEHATRAVAPVAEPTPSDSGQATDAADAIAQQAEALAAAVDASLEAQAA